MKKHSRNRNEQNPDLPWWSFLSRRWFLARKPLKRGSLPDQNSRVSGDETVPYQSCRHGRLRKAVHQATARLLGKNRLQPDLPGLCPICGLFAEPDRVVKYVLTLWFIDDRVCEYHFIGRRRNDCYRIDENSLHVYLKDSVMSHSLDMISAMNFGPREIKPESPEVIEAERILSSRKTDF